VARLVEAQRYEPESRGFDYRRCHWNFSMTQSFRLHYGSGVDSDSNIHNHKQRSRSGNNFSGNITNNPILISKNLLLKIHNLKYRTMNIYWGGGRGEGK
jgi:hypothetical protein